MSATPATLIRDDIRSMSAYHVPDASGMVKLDAMENPYQLPDWLRQELVDVLAVAELNRYPDPSASMLRQTLRHSMKIPDGCDVLLGNGSDELIQIMVNACARKAAVILAPSPSFVMYGMYARIAGIDFVGVSLEADFSLNADRVLSAIRDLKPALIFVAYPNNPTGNLVPDDVMTAILNEAPGLVVVDEAYQPFAGKSWMGRLPEFANLVVLRTLSKLGLAGIRLGYAVARPEWIREFNKVRSPYNVNTLTQLVAEHVLRRFDVLEQQAATICANRETLIARLGTLPGITAYPSSANFVLVRSRNASAVFGGMRDRKVLVKNLHGTHPILEQCLRITIGTPAENELMLAAMKASLSDTGRGALPGLRVG